jgi:hypothetical protein
MTVGRNRVWFGSAFAPVATDDWRVDMRLAVIAFAVLACAALPQNSSADDLTSVRSPDIATRSPAKSQWPKALHGLSVNLISKAHAAECTQEGETCTSNEQCCPGLECTGGPPSICAAED